MKNGGDPLKEHVGYWHVDVELVCRVDSELAFGKTIKVVCMVDKQAEAVRESVLGNQALRYGGVTLEVRRADPSIRGLRRTTEFDFTS